MPTKFMIYVRIVGFLADKIITISDGRIVSDNKNI